MARRRKKRELQNPLTVGERIELTDHEEKLWLSMVQDTGPGLSFAITLPTRSGISFRLPPGEKVKVHFCREDAQYSFEADLVRYYQDGHLQLVELRVASAVERKQRREYFRLATPLPFSFRIIDQEKEEEDGEVHKGLVLDISGGGAKVLSPIPLSPGQWMECRLDLEEEGRIDVRAEVLRLDRLERPELEYEMGLRFVDLDRDTRDRIVQFIFRKQQLLLRKRFL
ncbi:MAG: flagellar brake protein [Clostridia bacterium]|jgi:c-di-GMP-binding flagellar brake protein YcgR